MAYVDERLAERWSPEQIAGRLAARPPADLEGLSISHTTIYRWIWSDPERTRQFRPFLRIAQSPAASPTANPPAGARSRANAPLTSGRKRSTNEPGWAIGKATPWSAKATRASS